MKEIIRQEFPELKTLFDHLSFAKSKGLRWPAIRINGFKFQLPSSSPDSIRNFNRVADTIVYVYKTKPVKEYVGFIRNNQFKPRLAANISAEDCDIVDEIIRDLPAAILLDGQRTGQCCACGRTLYAGESIAQRMGPICAEKFGFFLPSVAADSPKSVLDI